MKPNLQRRIQRYGWDKASAHYEGFWSEQLEPAQRRLLQRIALAPGEAVLDTACGTGLVTFPAAAAVGPSGRVTATDISAEMVGRGTRLAAERGFSNTAFRRMGSEALDLDDASFDAALCCLGLMYFPSPVAALSEMRRTLVPGGRLGVCVWGARTACGWAEIFPIVDARVETDVCPMFFQLGTGDALRYALDEAGFEEITIERMNSRLHYDSAEDACGAAFAGGPVALAHERFDEETQSEAYAEYLDSIAPFATGSGYEIPGEFVLATARREA